MVGPWVFAIATTLDCARVGDPRYGVGAIAMVGTWVFAIAGI
jgi:hypothetical protein